MKLYVEKTLKYYQQPPPPKPSNGPTPYTAPIYGKSVHYVPIEEENTNRQANLTRTRSVRKIPLPSNNCQQHNDLCIIEKKVTQSTTRSLTHFLNYCSSKPYAEIIYIKVT